MLLFAGWIFDIEALLLAQTLGYSQSKFCFIELGRLIRWLWQRSLERASHWLARGSSEVQQFDGAFTVFSFLDKVDGSKLNIIKDSLRMFSCVTFDRFDAGVYMVLYVLLCKC